jgi:glutaredoxin-like protein NrdH
MSVTIYTLPVCVQCSQTKRVMDREGIDYDTVSLLDVPELAAEFKAAGFLQAPIVVGHDGRRWSGFLPDEIMKLKTEALGAGD